MASDGVMTLAYAVRGRVLAKYYGQLSLSLVLLLALPLAAALLDGAYAFAFRLAVVLGLLVAVGVPLGRLPAPSRMQSNEAMVLVVALFITAALAMTWPFMAAGLTFTDALFEAVSGVTTTGLTTLPGVETESRAFLFSRAWMQWYGGLVIVVLAVALVVRPGRLAKRLAGAEPGEEDLVGGTRARARRVLVVYAALTAAGLLVLLALGVPWPAAVDHILSAVSTGGFSTYDDSLAGFGRPVQAALALFSLAGAVSFALYSQARTRGLGHFLRDAELHALLGAGLFTALLLALFGALASPRPWADLGAEALLTAFSAQTTTGFATLAVADLDAGSKLALIGSMFVGGDLGSTAGGIKVLRLLLILRLLQLVVLRACLPPHALSPVSVAGRRPQADEIQSIVTVVFFFLAVNLVSWLCFVAAGHAPLDSLFEVVSATATTGLSTGVTSPGLEGWLKGVLCLDMLMGRLEVVAVLVLLYPRTWLGRRSEST